MNIKELSKKYVVKKLGYSDVPEIYHLCCKNKLYYEYCPPMVTEESIKADMIAHPPNTRPEDVFYLGYYADGAFIAVLDLVYGYPKQDIAYIGFFMTSTEIQKREIGSEIISELCEALKQKGFSAVRLAWVKGNPQAEHFWLKNGFVVLKETTSNAADAVLLAERKL